MKRIRHRITIAGVLRSLLQISGFVLSAGLLVVIVVMYSTRQESVDSTVSILVARNTIPPGQPVTSDDLSTFQVRATAIPPNAFSQDQLDELLRLEPITAIREGDIIQRSDFQSSTEGNTLPENSQLVFIRFSEVYVFPPELAVGSPIRIRALDQASDDQAPEIVLESAIVHTIYSTTVDEEEQTVMISIALSESETTKLTPYLTEQWQLYLTVLPDTELDSEDTPATSEASLDATSSAQIINRSAQENEATDSANQ